MTFAKAAEDDERLACCFGLTHDGKEDQNCIMVFIVNGRCLKVVRCVHVLATNEHTSSLLRNGIETAVASTYRR